ncbi:MAG TPA: DUF4340 domain-containing protein [Bacteroidota bacterium]|nr:DUF4340 domain-containing protein [Bacteroidota bacterium]
MNRSTVLLIVLLLVIGAIVWFLIPSDKEREISDSSPDVAIHIDSASVVKLEIQHAPKLILLENIGGKWTITAPARYQADPVSVTRLIGGLSRFKIGSLISSNPEKQHLFQVDTGGTHIIVTERSGKSTSLVIGKMGPSFSEVYFRVPTSKDVYLGEGVDSWSVNKDLKEWRDKTIFAQPAEAIRSLTLNVKGKEYDFHKDSTSWKSGDRTVETSEINPLLTTLANLRADDFVDTAMKFQAQPATIGVQGAENISLTLYPVLPDSSKYIVQTSTSAQLYSIGKFTAQQLLNPVEHAAGRPAPAPSITQASRPPEKKPVAAKEEMKEEKKPEKTAEKAPEKTAEKTEPPKEEPKVVPSPFGGKKTQPSQSLIIPKKEVAPPPVVETAPAKKTGKQASPSFNKPKTETQADRTNQQQAQQQQSQQQVQQQTHQPTQQPPQQPARQPAAKPAPKSNSSSSDDEGDLTVHTVKKGETMQSIARFYGVTVEQILKWNLLKSISVKPGQELYVYIRK